MDGMGLFAMLLLAGMTFPLAFWIAKICLAGIFVIIEVIIESDDRRRKGEGARQTAKLQPCRTP